MVNVSVTIRGNQLKIDFAGSSSVVSGFINSPIANTKTYAIIPVLCSIKQTIPQNDGLFRAIEIIAPQGSAVNPSFPAPVGLCPFHLGAQISEAVAKALAQAVPTEVGVTWANLPQILIEDQNPRGKRCFFFQAPLTIGGCGACYGYDGWGWPSPFGRLRLPSIEILETQYHYFVEQRELVVNSGGAGKWRGGLGTKMIFSLTRPSKLTAFTQGIKWPMAGFNGGREGSPNALILKHSSTEKEEANPLFYRRNIVAGDRICIEQGGGGGWGNSLERDPELVKEDVLDEYISVEGAERNYGVIINPVTFEVDYELTAARRREMSENIGG
jgi:N-methylhydantoinase B